MSRTVVVIGGGYGGSAVAKALDPEADVVLIDPRDAFVNSAGSLRALTQPDWAGNMFFPYDQWLRRGTVVRDRAVSVDPGGVTLASGRRVEADYLVLATGSSYAAQLRGERPTATYQPLLHPMILLPLGPRGGVGQLPTPDGPAVVPAETVSAYKGADLFTGRFTEQFGAA
ncbi:FAD-dependent oxidoreductase [Nonomuraea sp. NPDC046570]|uniref:FAD-dependent oxidoreductase n=1 Tax=Nonomuraea sp. NPDC046570 TaxID=3155255 RepID=UPI0033CDB45C